jgi:hypothetical protein
MMFISQHQNMLLIHHQPVRELREQYPGMELIRTFQKIQDAITWCQRQPQPWVNLTGKMHSGITPAGRERMREHKRGANNPNASGLSPEHRERIARALRRIRQGEHHPMWNRRHRVSSRLKTSFSMQRLPKRCWYLDAEGQEHLCFVTDPVPPTWRRGRKRGQAGRYIHV